MLNNHQTAERYDVVVIGGGHAGCEASLASARLKANTLLITNGINKIAAISCNPSIGGVGKGQLIKEINILGGEMSRVADLSCIHSRILNATKGAAVRSTRLRIDSEYYRKKMLTVILNTPNFPNQLYLFSIF